MLKETFTEADKFVCKILNPITLEERILIFSAFVLIDITQFENNSSGSSGFDLPDFFD